MIVILLGGVVGLVVAAALVVLLRRVPLGRVGVTATVGLLVSVVLLGPTLAIEAAETIRFRALGLTEAGIPRNQEPPFSEAFIADARRSLTSEATWAVVTRIGRCEDAELAYQWLAFRLHPNRPDCDAPDRTFWTDGIPPPAGADPVASGEDWVITR